MNRFLDLITSRNTIAGTGTTLSAGLLVLRVGMGVMMAFGHGWGKLAGFGESADKFADPYGLGSPVTLSLAVFACSLALALGLLTRAAVIPLIVTMLTAAFMIHADDPFGRKEMALMYLAPFVTILITGPGRYSLDRLFKR
jgi:putative oxidoreductase